MSLIFLVGIVMLIWQARWLGFVGHLRKIWTYEVNPRLAEIKRGQARMRKGA